MSVARAPRASYVALARSGELAERARRLEAGLTSCTVCPRRCGVDRRRELGDCGTGPDPVVASWTPHFGEEPPISGRHGSGTVFLANCNLRCVFCQNHEISQPTERPAGREMSAEALAAIFLELADLGCHNINWVSPTHQVPQLVRALDHAARRGLSLPVVYNTNAYDAAETVRLLDGIVDVYMPDLKYADNADGEACSGVPDYADRARAALGEMYRQVGDTWDADAAGVMRRGMLVRMLVLPNDLAGIEDNLRWISRNLSPRVTISLMAQYYPAHLAAAGGHPLLQRRVSSGEWRAAVDALLRHMSGERHYVQNRLLAPDYYRPDFSDRDRPFRDIRDFTDGE